MRPASVMPGDGAAGCGGSLALARRRAASPRVGVSRGASSPPPSALPGGALPPLSPPFGGEKVMAAITTLVAALLRCCEGRVAELRADSVFDGRSAANALLPLRTAAVFDGRSAANALLPLRTAAVGLPTGLSWLPHRSNAPSSCASPSGSWQLASSSTGSRRVTSVASAIGPALT